MDLISDKPHIYVESNHLCFRPGFPSTFSQGAYMQHISIFFLLQEDGQDMLEHRALLNYFPAGECVAGN